MTKELRKELFDACGKDNRLYGYVADNYWKLSKEDLKNILLEVIAASETNCEELEVELMDRFPEEDYEDE